MEKGTGMQGPNLHVGPSLEERSGRKSQTTCLLIALG